MEQNRLRGTIFGTPGVPAPGTTAPPPMPLATPLGVPCISSLPLQRLQHGRFSHQKCTLLTHFMNKRWYFDIFVTENYERKLKSAKILPKFGHIPHYSALCVLSVLTYYYSNDFGSESCKSRHGVRRIVVNVIFWPEFVPPWLKKAVSHRILNTNRKKWLKV